MHSVCLKFLMSLTSSFRYGRIVSLTCHSVANSFFHLPIQFPFIFFSTSGGLPSFHESTLIAIIKLFCSALYFLYTSYILRYTRSLHLHCTGAPVSSRGLEGAL